MSQILILVAAWTGIALPFIFLAFGVFYGNFDANPVELLIHLSGNSCLAFLIASLAVTPGIRLLKIQKIFWLRRFFGLTSFWFALVHMSLYLVFDKNLDVYDIAADVFKRKFQFLGLLAFIGLLILAVTSTRKMMKILGKRWKIVHSFVYLVLVISICHYYMSQKADVEAPIYAAIAASLLLLYRLVVFVLKKQKFQKSKRLSTGP